MTLDEQIQEEVALYIGYCERAACHGDDEKDCREMARRIFYHIQELRSTGVPSPLTRTA